MLEIITGIIEAIAVVIDGTGLGDLLKVAIEVLKVIANAFVELAKVLGLVKPETTTEELGDKALQYEHLSGKTIADFDDFDEYWENVGKQPLDPELSKRWSEKEKLAKATEVSIGAMENKFKDTDLDIGAYLTLFGNKLQTENGAFTLKHVAAFGEILKTDEAGAKLILDYLNRKSLSGAQTDKAFEKLMELEKTVNPSISDRDAERNIINMRR